MGRLIFGSAEERGKAQSKIAALILAGVLIFVVPSILLVYMKSPGEPFNDANHNGVWDTGETWTDVIVNGHYDATGVSSEAESAIRMLINGVQWIGVAVLIIGFIWAGISLRFLPRF